MTFFFFFYIMTLNNTVLDHLYAVKWPRYVTQSPVALNGNVVWTVTFSDAAAAFTKGLILIDWCQLRFAQHTLFTVILRTAFIVSYVHHIRVKSGASHCNYFNVTVLILAVEHD